MNIIEVNGLHKAFGEVKAVQDISFQVKEGELFAYLGVNGAGKSTTISILCSQLAKDAGTVRIDGCDPDEEAERVKRALGVVYQASALDRPLTVRDNLAGRAALYGIHGKEFECRLQELCDLLEMKDILKRPLAKLSGGQKRKVDIARALLHRPKILILDEPTTGLDPKTRRTIWDVIDRLRRDHGLTVFLTTHYMEEAADADYVVILDQGKVVAQGTPLELKNQYSGDFLTLYGAEETKVAALGYPYEAVRDGFRIALPDTAAATALFVDYELIKGKMDDVFLAVTGKRVEGEEQQ